jgi:hypothetical protein
MLTIWFTAGDKTGLSTNSDFIGKKCQFDVA